MISSEKTNNVDELLEQQNSGEKANEKQHEDDSEKRKFQLGSNILYFGLATMLGCIVLSIIWPENIFISNAFETIRLIVMTILGYIFGSGSQN